MNRGENLFSFVKRNVKISDYVKTLPNTKGLHSVGPGRFRCNNVIANGKNTNAMVIDDESGFFKVFSHGNESGDVITLYSLMNGGDISPRDSAIQLASDMGIAIDQSLLKSRSGGESKNVLTSAMDKLCDYAHNYLVSSDEEDAKKARQYLHDRGMPDSMRDEWKIGLFPSIPGDSLDMVEECGGIDIFRKTGIVSDGDNPIVIMSGRLVFPIFSSFGQCVSFSSRIIPGIQCYLEDSKYINTSSTPIYQKREILYGMHNARRSHKDTLIICEGNMDVIALNEQTKDNVLAVATCGTSFTPEHASWISKNRFTTIILYFDSDEAGKNATKNSLWILNNLTYVMSPILHGDNKDPWDSYESGEKPNLNNLQPLITACVTYSKGQSKEENIEWIKKSWKTLNFEQDKELLISESERILGLSKRQILQEIGENQSYTNNKKTRDTSSSEKISITPSVKTLVSAMLSIPMAQRKTVFFPFYNKTTVQKALILSGAKKQEDITVLRIVMGIEKNSDSDIMSYIGSLTPNPDNEDNTMYFAAKMIATNLISEWGHYGMDNNYIDFISPISNIHGGIDTEQIPGIEQLSLVMNATGSIH